LALAIDWSASFVIRSLQISTFETWIRFWNAATWTLSEKFGYTIHNNLPFHHNLMFGYDNSTDTYKVAYLVPNTNKIHVFCMGDNVWRNIQKFPIDHCYSMNVVNLSERINCHYFS